MPTSGEHKTVQARILTYAQEAGWHYVPQAEAERRRGFEAQATGSERYIRHDLFRTRLFELMTGKVRVGEISD